MNITILGHGAWGTAIASLVRNLGHHVALVSHQENTWPKPHPDYLFIALPVQHIRETLTRFSAPCVPVLSLSKGLEIQSGQRVSEIIQAVWGEIRVASLSGPTFATEVMAGLPATAVIAGVTDELALEFQSLFHQPAFRIYRSSDLVGVELGGALKNIYAIAGGACHGLKLGQNSLAGLLTRCLAEMTRIGVRAGARGETFSGLSGMGDLLLTATSAQSRNFRLGALLAEGMSVEHALPKLGGVCEGVSTARAVYLNQAISDPDKPIVTELHHVLYEGAVLKDAVRNLLNRAARDE